MYINDIQLDLESEVLIYADDTTLLAFGKNPVETASILNRDLRHISDWAKLWKISFNADKSRDKIFSEKSFPYNPDLLIDGEIIKQVTVHKYLGLILSSNLDWSFHVQYVCLRVQNKLAVLRSIAGLQRRTLDLLYKIQVRSIIDNALPVYWHTLRVSEKNRFEQLQYKSAKIVTGALHLTSREK